MYLSRPRSHSLCPISGRRHRPVREELVSQAVGRLLHTWNKRSGETVGTSRGFGQRQDRLGGAKSQSKERNIDREEREEEHGKMWTVGA